LDEKEKKTKLSEQSNFREAQKKLEKNAGLPGKKLHTQVTQDSGEVQ